jgi:hypothetical protein
MASHRGHITGRQLAELVLERPHVPADALVDVTDARRG